MRSFTHAEFERVKQGHSKVKHISHKDLKKPQAYLMDAMFNNTESLLFNLRSQSVNEFKGNFFISFCQFYKSYLDTQDQAWSCNILRSHMEKELQSAVGSVKYNIFVQPKFSAQD